MLSSAFRESCLSACCIAKTHLALFRPHATCSRSTRETHGKCKYMRTQACEQHARPKAHGITRHERRRPFGALSLSLCGCSPIENSVLAPSAPLRLSNARIVIHASLRTGRAKATGDSIVIVLRVQDAASLGAELELRCQKGGRGWARGWGDKEKGG